jgi:hypothetical protein
MFNPGNFHKICINKIKSSLSAVVGVFGYLIQAKMARKAETRRREEDKAAKANEMLLHHIETKISLFIGPASALALASARAMFQFRASAKVDYPQECAEYEAIREERVSSKKRGVACWCGDFVVCVFCCSVDVVVVLYIC